jgi:hypothetical protein
MLTREQRAAIARRNGARSRGPVTAAGKARSSRNGLRQGLTAVRHLLLEGEAPDAFEQLRQACLARFQPAGPLEIRLVERIAEASWKLQRADALETGALNLALANSPGLAAAFQLPEVQRVWIATALRPHVPSPEPSTNWHSTARSPGPRVLEIPTDYEPNPTPPSPMPGRS